MTPSDWDAVEEALAYAPFPLFEYTRHPAYEALSRLKAENERLGRLVLAHVEKVMENFARAERAEAENERLREALREIDRRTTSLLRSSGGSVVNANRLARATLQPDGVDE